ncbi:MAG: FAD-dependent oxidoreductase, partial [Pseudomonadota bacterium]
PGFAKDNKAGEHYIRYHRRYAAEGVGLQFTGGTPVHRSGMLSLRSDALWNLDDSVVPGYRVLAEAVHAEGGCMLAQLAHSGGTVHIDTPGFESWSASAVRSAVTGHRSHAMSLAEIDEVVRAFAAAAARVRQGGLDGVEILAAFGFLPQAFLSPLTNHRTDHYGGSLENRMRFLVAVLRAVRAELGPDQMLGVRLPGDEFEPGGLTLGDMTQVCAVLCQDDLVDYVNITAHTNVTHTGRSRHWAPTPTPHGVFVDLADAIKRCVSKPVFTVGRIVDPAHANRIIAEGKADVVGMTRAHICDPTIVSKITQGRGDEIRPCVGANTCIANRYAGKAIRCMHNPLLRRPGEALSRAEASLTVTVVGGGPAGLEAARLAAERGHRVAVLERGPEVGGQLNRWTAVASTRELRRVVQWRVSELRRLGVVVHLDTDVDSAALSRMDSDVIVLATGSHDSRRTLPGNGGVRVLSPTALLDGGPVAAKRALVVSDGRGQAGLVCAEWLTDHGVHVDIVTEDMAVALDLDPTNRNAWYERLGRRGVGFTAQTVIEQVSGRTVALRNPYTTQTATRVDIDLIVDWQGTRPDTLAVPQYQQTTARVFRIGDCVAPGTVETAMASALDVADAL